MNNVQRFWCHEAQNIRCVRDSDYAKLAAEAQALREEVAKLRARVVPREVQAVHGTGVRRDRLLRQPEESPRS